MYSLTYAIKKKLIDNEPTIQGSIPVHNYTVAPPLQYSFSQLKVFVIVGDPNSQFQMGRH